MKTKLLPLAAIALWGLVATNVLAEQNEVYIIKVADAISPGTADFIKTGIKTAEERAAAVIIIELDTPGGLAESMRLIVQRILSSKVPVVRLTVTAPGYSAAAVATSLTGAAGPAAPATGWPTRN